MKLEVSVNGEQPRTQYDRREETVRDLSTTGDGLTRGEVRVDLLRCDGESRTSSRDTEDTIRLKE